MPAATFWLELPAVRRAITRWSDKAIGHTGATAANRDAIDHLGAGHKAAHLLGLFLLQLPLGLAFGVLTMMLHGYLYHVPTRPGSILPDPSGLGGAIYVLAFVPALVSGFMVGMALTNQAIAAVPAWRRRYDAYVVPRGGLPTAELVPRVRRKLLAWALPAFTLGVLLALIPGT